MSPCLHEFRFIWKKCLALSTGMQRGAGFWLILLLCSFCSLSLLPLWATPIPYRIIMSFCFSFRSPSLVSFGCFCSYFRTISALGPPPSILHLSLSNAHFATNRTKETRKTKRNTYPHRNNPINIEHHNLLLFIILDKQKMAK